MEPILFEIVVRVCSDAAMRSGVAADKKVRAPVEVSRCAHYDLFACLPYSRLFYLN